MYEIIEDRGEKVRQFNTIGITTWIRLKSFDKYPDPSAIFEIVIHDLFLKAKRPIELDGHETLVGCKIDGVHDKDGEVFTPVLVKFR